MFPDLYTQHIPVCQQSATETTRLPGNLICTTASTYSLHNTMSYSSALLPIPSSSSNPLLLSASPVPSITSSTYQHHHLPPTPTSLITMMGPNSGSSNSTSEPLPNVSVGSLSPAQQHQHNLLHHQHHEQQPQLRYQHQQHQQPQQQFHVSSASWNSLPSNLEAASIQNSLSNTSATASSAKLAAAVHLHQQHQVFTNHYNQSFPQSRQPTHQHFYNWYS